MADEIIDRYLAAAEGISELDDEGKLILAQSLASGKAPEDGEYPEIREYIESVNEITEALKSAEGWVKVAEHSDLTDTDQTVTVPSLKTTATNADTGTHSITTLTTAKDAVKVKDRVDFTGLETDGTKYELTATLMDKKTGKAVTLDGKEVTASVKFTCTSPDGYAEVTLSFVPTTLEGDYVVFEELRDADTGVLIAEHRDLEDKDQTVTVGHTIQTGDSSNKLPYILIAALAAAAIAAVAAIMARRRRTR